jgi:hypothetical protein
MAQALSDSLRILPGFALFGQAAAPVVARSCFPSSCGGSSIVSIDQGWDRIVYHANETETRLDGILAQWQKF